MAYDFGLPGFPGRSYVGLMGSLPPFRPSSFGVRGLWRDRFGVAVVESASTLLEQASRLFCLEISSVLTFGRFRYMQLSDKIVKVYF